jgi:dynein heavy chain
MKAVGAGDAFSSQGAAPRGSVVAVSPGRPMTRGAPSRAHTSFAHRGGVDKDGVYDPTLTDWGDSKDPAVQLELRTGDDAVSYFTSHRSDRDPIKFVYLNRARTGDVFRPYDLEVVPRELADPEHFTLSFSGIVHVRTDGPSEFISLEDWMKQSTHFNMLSSIKYFKHFLVLKYFKVWRSHVRYQLYCQKRERIQNKLFLAKDTFLPSLLEVSKQCVEMSKIPLVAFSTDAYNRDEYTEMQLQTRTAASKAFELSLDRLQDVVEKLCEDVIRRAKSLEDPDVEVDEDLRKKLLEGAARSKAGQEKNRIRELRKATIDAHMLSSFIRLADFIAIETMMGMVFDTSQRLVAQLRNPLPKNGLFQTMVGFGDAPGLMTFSPNQQDISGLIKQTVEGMVSVVHSVPRVMHMRSLKNFFIVNQSSTVPEGLNLQRALRADEPFRLSREAMEETVVEDFDRAAQVAQIFEEFREVHEFGQTWNFTAYQEEQPNLAKMSKDMNRLRDWTKRVEQRIKMQVPAGILNVDAKLMKAHLLPIVTSGLDKLKTYLSKLARDKCNGLRSTFTSHIRALSEKPRHLKDFAEYITTTRQLEAESVELLSDVALLDSMYDILDQFEVQREYVDSSRFEEVHNLVSNFGESVEQANGKISQKLPSMVQQTEKKLQSLKGDLQAIITDLSSGIFVEARTEPKTAVARLDEVKKALDTLHENIGTLRGYMDLFGTPTGEVAVLDAAESLFGLRYELWTSIDRWNEDVAQWKFCEFSDLEVDKVEAEIFRVYKLVLRLDKKLKDDEAVKDFRVKVEEMKAYAPLLLELGNPALKARHWEQIFRGLNQAWYPGRSFNLGNLISMDVLSHRHMISEISGIASGEYSLVLMLEKIKDTWENMEYDIQPHKRGKNAYILASVEDITATLEDNQVTLQSMFASRWVVGIREEVDMWEHKLALLSEVLDEWVACQRSWMYLEVIFSQQDIQRQLLQEYSKFGGVDKKWRDFMRNTYGDPKVLQAVTTETLETLAENNRILEAVQKSLEDYLETKRVSFPRFYFLSNDELLEILSQTMDPLAVQPHLRKCFENMHSLEFRETETGNVEALGMASGEGERVSFVKEVLARGLVENWLSHVELAMAAALKSQMGRAVKMFPAMGHAEWMFSFPAQVVIAVEQIMWAAGVEAALRKVQSGEAPDALRAFQAQWRVLLDSLVGLVRGNLTPLQRSIVGVLIVIDVHARDVVESLLKEGCSSVADFGWTKQLRYYWDAGLETCVIRQTNTRFVYGYEYLGSTPRLVITPLTDRCYMTLTGALHFNLGGAPAGPAGTGKTESTKDLAKALARQCVVFNCIYTTRKRTNQQLEENNIFSF